MPDRRVLAADPEQLQGVVPVVFGGQPRGQVHHVLDEPHHLAVDGFGEVGDLDGAGAAVRVDKCAPENLVLAGEDAVQVRTVEPVEILAENIGQVAPADVVGRRAETFGEGLVGEQVGQVAAPVAHHRRNGAEITAPAGFAAARSRRPVIDTSARPFCRT